MSSGSRRPIYLLVALLAAAAAITVALLQGLGSGPESEPTGEVEAGAVAAQGPGARASSEAAPSRRADAPAIAAAPGARGSGRHSVVPTPQRRPPPTAPRLPGQAAPPAPTLEMPAVSAALQAAKPAVDRCYEQGKKTNPKLKGTATLRFTVVVSGGRGQILDSALRGSDFRDPELEHCLVDAFHRQHFDAPGPDGRRTLDFPIMLGPVGKRPQ